MITLTVKPYCENCMDFKPKVERDILFDGDDIVHVLTDVTCKYRDRCENMKKYLEKESKKKVGDR